MEIIVKNKILNAELTDGQVGLFYRGQLGFMIKFRGKYILIDGYLSDYVDKNCSREAFPMVRNYPVPVRPEELDFVDYVFCTHDHADHTDPYTVSGIASVNKKALYFAPQGVSDKLIEYGAPADSVCGVCCDSYTELCDGIGFAAVG